MNFKDHFAAFVFTFCLYANRLSSSHWSPSHSIKAVHWYLKIDLVNFQFSD